MVSIFPSWNPRSSLGFILSFKLNEEKFLKRFILKVEQDNANFSVDKDISSKKKYNSKLLRKRYPHGKHGYWLEFYINEFWRAIEDGNPKALHVHITFKSSGGDYLKVNITYDKKDIEIVRPEIKKEHLRDDAKKMYNFIRDELDNIMEEITERLSQESLKLTKIILL